MSGEKQCYLIAVRTVNGQEYNIAYLLRSRIENKNLDIASLTILPDLRGFILVESELHHLVQNIAYGLKHTKGVVRGKILADEIINLLTRPIQIGIGDVVEIVAGPFRGRKAKVVDIDQRSEIVHLEIIDATSPMPVILKVRDIRKSELRR